MSNAIRAEGLVKTFGATRALDGVDLEVPAGTVLGLLGPNGAGKTTAVRVLATLLRPDAGRAWVGGHDVVRAPQQVRRLIALTGQYAAVDETLSGRENLYIIGRLLDLPRRAARRRAGELLERFSLAEAAGKLVKTYSGGMRRRLDLAASLIGEPSVLFLDEPTTGLDPRSRIEVWAMVRELLAGGTTVLLTTQYLDEADQLAHAITVVDHGRVIASGTPDELKAKVGRRVLEARPADPADLPVTRRVLTQVTGAEADVDADQRLVSVPVVDGTVLAAAVRLLDDAGVVMADLGLRRASLDEVFLALTGGPESDPGNDDERSAV
jgi:oleandomycin transport system ATP-binding protein